MSRPPSSASHPDQPREHSVLELADLEAATPPTTKLLNLILLQAIKDRASDLHLELYEKEFIVRYRIDGELREMMPPPLHLAATLLNRVKVMAGLESTEHLRPQTGRVLIDMGGRPVDLIVNTLPCSDGERVTIRISDPDVAPANLEAAGLSGPGLSQMRSWSRRPQGLILVAGVGGSGKTSLLYALLRELRVPQKAIVTVEDPISSKLSRISQVAARPETGFGVAQAVAAAMQQACDILMVDRLPDAVTLERVCQAALGGRLVLSALAAADAPSALAQLLHMGIQPYLVSAALLGVTGQRLVRRLCESCREPAEPSALASVQRAYVGEAELPRLFRARGCARCNKSGYAGRTALFEFLPVEEAMRAAILRGATEAELRTLVLATGLRSLRDDGLAKVTRGETSLEELMRVLP